MKDVLFEKKITVMPGVIRRYNNRILWQLTMKCATECAFCYRKWNREEQFLFEMGKNEIDNAIEYIKLNKEINEVVLSGGDPLINLAGLKYSLEKLNDLEQIKVIRIHTRVPIVRPNLINNDVLNILNIVDKKLLYLSLHVNNVNEINNEVENVILKFRKMGIILFSQSVFLKNINDNLEELEKLFNKLHFLGVRPYNIYHCSDVDGIEKFRVDIKKERHLMTLLKQRVSGLACPTFILDAPETAEKIPVPLEFWDCNMEYFVNFEGKKIKDF